MRLRSLILAAAFPSLASLVLASCHGTVTLDQACAERAAVSCARLAECRPSQLVSDFGDEDTCRQRTTVGCMNSAPLRLPAWQPAEVAACTEEMTDARCVLLPIEQAIGPACAKLWRGSRADGEPCSGDMQCQSGRCEDLMADGCGSCVHAGQLGETCKTSPLPTCALGLFCDVATERCTASKTEGEPCTAYTGEFACAAGLLCHDGRCARLPVEGEACDLAQLPCAMLEDLECDPTERRCIKIKPLLAAAGMRCGAAHEPPIVCVKGFCAGSWASGTGTCVARIEDGHGCALVTDGINDPCIPPALCIDGQCSLPDPLVCEAP